ncbi:MAG: TlpA disulfide reductase family protein [Bacteroidota bacterium]
MILKWKLCALMLWVWVTLYGQNVSIEALSPDYSGKAIHTIVAWNPFLTTHEYVSRVICDENGRFELSMELESARVIQFETGVYQAYLYMQPGFHYEVELPAYKEKEFSDQISPFFQAVVLPLRVRKRTSLSTGDVVEGRQDINYPIARFDTLFAMANNEVLMNRRTNKPSNLDSIILNLESEFAWDSTRFFSAYRKYRYGVLKLNEGVTGLEELSREYLGPEVREWHPGFIELFRAMFKDFIYYYGRTPEGNKLANYINRTQDLDSARHVILAHPAVWNDTLADMILLQELSEVFYRGDYHKEAILILLDSMIQDPVSPDFGVFAFQVRKKLASLVTGHLPPPFSLKDLAGNLVTLDDFRGRYVYLFFGTPDHYGCMMEYPFLQSYYEKHSDYLQVLTVMVSEEWEKLEDFMLRNGYGWKVLHYEEQPGLLVDYLVRAFPTAYLIGPDGKLILSPSPLPSDGFEQQLFRIMRSRGEI